MWAKKIQAVRGFGLARYNWTWGNRIHYPFAWKPKTWPEINWNRRIIELRPDTNRVIGKIHPFFLIERTTEVSHSILIGIIVLWQMHLKDSFKVFSVTGSTVAWYMIRRDTSCEICEATRERSSWTSVNEVLSRNAHFSQQGANIDRLWRNNTYSWSSEVVIEKSTTEVPNTNRYSSPAALWRESRCKQKQD